jgi:excinuclease ABC subunit C
MKNILDTLKKKADSFPAKPGVYIFKDLRGKPVYIGKAQSLRHRVRSYFQASGEAPIKQETMLGEAADIEFIITESELEALILENNLIKKELPKYNVQLRDDKSFPYLQLTINEPYPRVQLVRRVKKEGALYFGPYIPASLARKTMRLIARHMQLRQCDLKLPGRRYTPCLDYQINRCLAPCAGFATEEEYAAAVEDVKLLLEGKNKELLQRLKLKMDKAAEEEKFEKAAHYRDAITVLERQASKQRMASTRLEEEDLFGFYHLADKVCLQVFHIRKGLVVGRREFFWKGLVDFQPEEFIASMIKQYYSEDQPIPPKIYVQLDFEERSLLEQWLTQLRGSRVHITSPIRGKKRQLLQLALDNARISYRNKFSIEEDEGVLYALKQALSLPELPRRIEAFDISNISGTDAVASLVVFEDGKARKADYRRFKIKAVKGPDDFASMAEVVSRRYKRLLSEEKPLPDMVLLDGGKGQLSAARDVLTTLGLEDMPAVAIAKREEILYASTAKEPLKLEEGSEALRLLQRIRDESHRFALTYHRKLRKKRTIASELDNIPGIGAKRKALLLKYFGSLKAIKEANPKELARLVGKKPADNIKKLL